LDDPGAKDALRGRGAADIAGADEQHADHGGDSRQAPGLERPGNRVIMIR
jgi:hypothetical protein